MCVEDGQKNVKKISSLVLRFGDELESSEF